MRILLLLLLGLVAVNGQDSTGTNTVEVVPVNVVFSRVCAGDAFPSVISPGASWSDAETAGSIVTFRICDAPLVASVRLIVANEDSFIADLVQPVSALIDGTCVDYMSYVPLPVLASPLLTSELQARSAGGVDVAHACNSQ